MARPQITKVETIRRLKEIYEKDGYVTVWNIRARGMYYAVRKFWGSVSKMKKELGFTNGKTKKRYVQLRKYLNDIEKIAKIERKIQKDLSKTEKKKELGYSYYFYKYSKHSERIKKYLTNQYNKINNICSRIGYEHKIKSTIFKKAIKKLQMLSKMRDIIEDIQSNWFFERQKEKELQKIIKQMQKPNPIDIHMNIRNADKISDWDLFSLELQA